MSRASRDDVARRLASEARDVNSWSNGPGDRYAEHSHTHTKILYCLEGGIDFILADGRVIHLEAGDRMELPAGTVHSAVVGPRGVVWPKGRRRRSRCESRNHGPTISTAVYASSSRQRGTSERRSPRAIAMGRR